MFSRLIDAVPELVEGSKKHKNKKNLECIPRLSYSGDCFAKITFLFLIIKFYLLNNRKQVYCNVIFLQEFDFTFLMRIKIRKKSPLSLFLNLKL